MPSRPRARSACEQCIVWMMLAPTQRHYWNTILGAKGWWSDFGARPWLSCCLRETPELTILSPIFDDVLQLTCHLSLTPTQRVNDLGVQFDATLFWTDQMHLSVNESAAFSFSFHIYDPWCLTKHSILHANWLYLRSLLHVMHGLLQIALLSNMSTNVTVLQSKSLATILDLLVTSPQTH